MSTSLSPFRDVAVPDAIFGPEGSVESDNPDGLSPCPFCNAVPEDAPEGIHSYHSARKNGSEPGKAVWNHPHCWRCGYRPGTNVATSEAVMRRQFNAFKVWVAEQTKEAQSPELNSGQVDDLKAQLAAAQERESVLRAQLQGNEEDK